MVNQYKVKRPVRVCSCGAHAWLELTRGYCALISPSDADFIGQWNWSTLELTDGKLRAVRRTNADGKTYYMHREIIKPEGDDVVDHINADGLDNRRENLRACSNKENVRWSRPQRRAKSSRFKGVSYDRPRDKWQAYVNVDGKRVNIGRFDTEEDAARAYDAQASLGHGAFALTNEKLGLLP
jgi:hypothetical protein